MTEVAMRELRNQTAQLVERVEAGEHVVITKRGKPVAELVPVRPERRKRWASREELADWIGGAQADPGLRDDLRAMAEEEDAGPIV
jgi:prevent-host-death family protein